MTRAAVAGPRLVPDISKRPVTFREQPRRLEVGDEVPDFAMTGQDGKAVKLSELRGQCGRFDVYLYTMSAARFLSADG